MPQSLNVLLQTTVCRKEEMLRWQLYVSFCDGSMSVKCAAMAVCLMCFPVESVGFLSQMCGSSVNRIFSVELDCFAGF